MFNLAVKRTLSQHTVVTPGDQCIVGPGSSYADESIDHSFITITVSKEHVYGLTTDNQLMQCTGHHYSTTTWEPVNLYNPDQKFLDIAVTTNGILHAIDLRNGFLYKMDPVNLASNQHKMRLAPIARQIPLRSLACKEGTKMYAVGKEGLAVKLQTARLVGRDHWTVLGDQDYKLKKIAVGKQDGIKKKQIWGINMDDVAVLFDKKNKTWLDTKAQASGLDVTSDNDCIITRREDGCCMRWNGKSFQEVKNQEARGLASVSSFKKKCVLFGVEKESGKAVLLSVTKETK